MQSIAERVLRLVRDERGATTPSVAGAQPAAARA
jgi:hypothetical protein